MAVRLAPDLDAGRDDGGDRYDLNPGLESCADRSVCVAVLDVYACIVIDICTDACIGQRAWRCWMCVHVL